MLLILYPIQKSIFFISKDKSKKIYSIKFKNDYRENIK